jgi:phosphoribosyl 1,2-cyclic phosphodiesterase
MHLQVISSNSAGNAYILENDQEALLIECGVNFKLIKQALKFNLRKVAGCIVTHEHLDHAKGIRDVMDAGINVYASEGTHEALGTIGRHRTKFAYSGKSFHLGNFRIMPFDVKHDTAEPFGYLIQHPETGTTLFLTDSYYCEYKFAGLNNIIIEANHCTDILNQRVQDGMSPTFLRDRVFTSHMSIRTCKEALGSYDLSAVNNVVLIHLSDGNSDARRFKKEVEEQTGKVVHIAEPGLSISLSKQPF